MRDHQPITLELFNGLWFRGDRDSVPQDHFSDCNNIKFSEGSVLTRDGLGTHAAFKNIVRGYPFNQSDVLLDIDGNIYHTDRASPHSPILHIDGMTDFGMTKFGDRIYITPVGVSNDFVYVYKYGSASGARKAAGQPPSTAPGLSIGAAGNVEQGIHVFSVVYETDTGYLTQLGPRAFIDVPDGLTSIDLSIPVSPDSFVSKRHIVATKAIDPADFTGNLNGYQFFFVSTATVNNNTDTAVNANFYDAELLSDASHLDDLYSEIPNGDGLNLYHNRLVVWAIRIGLSNTRISDVLVSNAGDPESVSQVDGLVSLTPDGRPITYCQELRDVLYIFKQTRTLAVTDNQDVPSSWPITVIDNGVGATAHGVATSLDIGGINLDYLLVGDFQGLLLFTGTYVFPELTWKVKDYWPNVDRALFTKLQVVIDSQFHFIYIALPDGKMLVGDYNNGLTFDKIKWAKWSFDVLVTSLWMLEESDRLRLIIASKNF